jgi:hypothetical protein
MAPGATRVNSPEFDAPSKMSPTTKTKDDSVAGGIISGAKSQVDAMERSASYGARPSFNSPNIGATVANASPAKMASMGLTERSPEERNAIGTMIAGEMTGTQLANLTSPDSGVRAKARSELANITTTVENRVAKFGSVANALKPSQYNSLMTDALPNGTVPMDATKANFAKYGKTITSTMDDFYNGTLAPTDYGLTSYYSKYMGTPPAWDANEEFSLTGQHKFGELSEYAPGEAFNSRRDSIVSQMDTRSQPVGFGKSATSSPGFAVSGASRSTAGKTFGSNGSRADSGIGTNDSAGAGRGSSPGGPTSGGIGRGSSGRSGESAGGNTSGGRAGSGKSASSSPGSSVSGASRSTSGKGGASPSASSGGQSGAAQSGTSGKTGSSGIGAGGSAGASQRSGGVF